MKKLLLATALVVGLLGCSSEDTRVEPTPSEPVRQVSISFDDGIAAESIVRHLWLFDRYDAKMTFFVSNPWHFTFDEVKRIQDAGHEVGHHTYIHKDAPAYAAEFGIEQWYADEIVRMSALMAEHGIHPTSFAYPFGSYSEATDTRLKDTFKRVRYFDGGSDSEYKPSSGYAIRSYSIDAHKLDMLKVYDAMDAIQDGETLYLTSHAIGEWINEWHITADNLEAILSYGHSTGITFCTMEACDAD